ncbi:hypothetical protein BLNAU_22921 [Blattamonas nauphoetae]|uniref:Uncharacterized protein n=1 Tax=Blattamonas nauphoetae TaxID=2049346 RepID=A0ABQ9WRN5_9EUKA|nr:hypothetical protein BLNAU_22921 [Blattamonas nauphoetae]
MDLTCSRFLVWRSSLTYETTPRLAEDWPAKDLLVDWILQPTGLPDLDASRNHACSRMGFGYCGLDNRSDQVREQRGREGSSRGGCVHPRSLFGWRCLGCAGHEIG